MAGQTFDFEGVTAWTDFKARLALKESKLQEISIIAGKYNLSFTENTDLYRISLTEVADINDYVANFQPSVNQKTENPVTVENTVNVDSDAAGDFFSDYLDHGTVISAATSDHDYVVPVGDLLKGRQLVLTGSGQWKADIFIDATQIATLIGTRARPSLVFDFNFEANAGETIKITFTNLDSESQCFYSTIVAGVIN